MKGHENRVPQIITLYWIIKIASTTLGETAADMVSMTFSLGYGSTLLLFVALFCVLVGIKLAVRMYNPILYWGAFTASAIAGTAFSDFIDRTLGLGYTFGSVILCVCLASILFVWRKIEKCISVENIRTARGEVFYWSAFFVANTLGTAAGDFLADELGVGFRLSALIIAVLLMGLACCYFFSSLSHVFLFWLSFVLTRPFGATFGDWLTKPRSQGGLDWGTIASSILFGVLLVLAVVKESQLEKARRMALDA